MPFALHSLRRFLLQCSGMYGAGRFTLQPAYVSGFWSLITLLVLSSGSVYAEWVAV